MTLPQFDGYDIVMLGDIHKYQVLQEYKTEHRFIPESKLDSYKLDGWDVMNKFLIKCENLDIGDVLFASSIAKKLSKKILRVKLTLM